VAALGRQDLVLALSSTLRKPARYLSKEQSVTLTLASGTPTDTEGFIEVTPLDGYISALRSFKLTTPLEVKGNVLLTGLDGEETRMLADDQAENLADQLYDASDWDADFFHLKKHRLYGLTTTALTADRAVVLKWSGGLVHALGSPNPYHQASVGLKVSTPQHNPIPAKLIYDRIKPDSIFKLERVEETVPLFKNSAGVYEAVKRVSFLSRLEVKFGES